MTSRYWCFTENTNAESFYNDLESIFMEQPCINYLCGQLERASTGQLHFQGYVQLDRSRARSFVKNWVSNTAHFERQMGTNEQARDYCRKNDTQESPFIEFGVFIQSKGSQGKRNDIIALRDHFVQGGNQRNAIRSDELVRPFARYVKFSDRVRMLFPVKKERTEDNFKISLYYGAPRTGKTRKAVEENEDLFECPIANDKLWFDGYDGHTVVLFDDFMGRGSKLGLDTTLKFFDRYVRKVPTKGGHSWYYPDHIIVTSNYHPRAWYDWKGREESWDALRLRFHEVVVFENGEQIVLEGEEVQDFMQDTDQWPEESTQNNITNY